MEFRTPLPKTDLGINLSHSQKILTMGSCFSEALAERLMRYKFDCISNTHGILFNPVSIFNALADVLNQKKYSQADLQRKETGHYFSYHLHSGFNSRDGKELLDTINENLEIAYDYLAHGDFLFITLGSAWVHQHLESKKYVANCHKQPTYLFEKVLLKPQTLLDTYQALLLNLHELNPKLKVIFTVSPVRHIKEGMVQNQRSKAILLYTIHELVEYFENCYYFPAYEAFIDDLRDYRFYDTDMLHPSKQGVDYVWDKFSETFFAPKTQELMQKIESIQKALSHRPFDMEAMEYVQLLQRQYTLMSTLEIEHRNISFADEKRFVQETLHKLNA